ncbi:MAG: alanine racemase [Bowdeniella nasicola]|nr:alanine racemase [Bowdeniella nasicola]
MTYPSRAIIDHAALAANLATLRETTSAELMPIVKADAYGHGLAACLPTLAHAGVRMVGIAQLAEALTVAEERPRPEIFTWLYSPHQGAELEEAVRRGMHLSVPAPWALDAVARAAHTARTEARVHLKVDTGMGRGGVLPTDLADLARRAAATEGVRVVGLWSHLARADDDRETTAAQERCFTAAVQEVRANGLAPTHLHLAASGGTLWHPACHHTHVRPGIALYGVSPDDSPAEALGLRPVMRLEADLISVKAVPEGTPVSYGHTQTVGPTTLGIVPLGYADGIDRAASSRAFVMVAGRRCPVVGRICMDQFVIDLGPDCEVRVGETATVWGASGVSASDWARAAGTIGYEMLARLGPRVPRLHVGRPR